MDWKPASVQWLKHEDGGRKVPPTGDEPPLYWAVVKLIGPTEPYSVSPSSSSTHRKNWADQQLR